MIDRWVATDQLAAGEFYKWSLKPSDYLRRQVRITPIPQFDQLHPTIDLGPQELFVFSSDYPHFEGRPDAVAVYEEQLAADSIDARESFFGESVAALLKL
jgi:uncharacterized protein